MNCVDSISCLEENLVDVTTPNGKNDFQPPSLTSTIPSRCMTETTNWNVDSETGSLESTGSELDLISGLNNGSGVQLRNVLELEETANPEVNTSAREMSNFDFTDSGPESISCVGMSSLDERDNPSDAPSGYMSSKLRKTTNLKACSEESSTNVTPEASLKDTQVSERLCQLAGINGASETTPGTLGLWALVVDAPPHDVRAVSEVLLATMIQDTGTGSNDGMEVLRGRCT